MPLDLSPLNLQPKSNTERSQRYVELLKQSGKYDDYKKKKALRQRRKDSLNKMTEKQKKPIVENVRLKSLERVRKHRIKKSMSQPEVPFIVSSSEEPPVRKKGYKTDGALSKATTKFRKGLPASPTKKLDVIEKFYNSLDGGTLRNLGIDLLKPKRNSGSKGISLMLTEDIIQFYERDDVSRTSPNVKDCRFYLNKQSGKQELKQKRHLVVTLAQAYDKFLIHYAGRSPLTLFVIIAKLMQFLFSFEISFSTLMSHLF